MRYTINKLNAMVDMANELFPAEKRTFVIKRRGSDCYGKNTAQVVAKYSGGAEADLTSWGSPREAAAGFYGQLKCISHDADKLDEIGKFI